MTISLSSLIFREARARTFDLSFGKYSLATLRNRRRRATVQLEVRIANSGVGSAGPEKVYKSSLP